MEFTLAELAEAVMGEVVGDGARVVTRPVHPNDAALPTHLAMAMHPSLLADLATSKAELAMVRANAEVPSNIKHYVKIARYQVAMAGVTARFDQPRFVVLGIHPTAIIHPTASVAADATIGAYCTIGAGSSVGAGAVLHPNVTVGAAANIGAGSILFSGVRVADDTQIGARCIIHSNAVLGADGFSFITPDPGTVEAAKSGENKFNVQNLRLLRIASLGPVIVGDEVEIGANTCIDRATLRTTRIGSGTKIDNLVQIGHNVEIGENCMICGQVGIAGSVKIGNRVVLAGRSGIADNVQVGDDAIVGAAAGVAGNVPCKTIVMGSPALPREKFQQLYMAQQRLPRLMQQMEALNTRLKQLEEAAEKR